jgi:hypothetical protein
MRQEGIHACLWAQPLRSSYERLLSHFGEF